jgi:hypothetical protein
MAKRPAIDLASLTAEAAEPMQEAVQRTPEPRRQERPPSLPSSPPSPPALAKRAKPKVAAFTAADLVPLYFKVDPTFNKRFRRHAFEADLKLNELLFEALDAWEEKKKSR